MFLQFLLVLLVSFICRDMEIGTEGCAFVQFVSHIHLSARAFELKKNVGLKLVTFSMFVLDFDLLKRDGFVDQRLGESMNSVEIR